MKTITLQELEEQFDAVMDDVTANKEHYCIKSDSGDVMLIPFDSYELLHDVYIDWVEQPKQDLS